MVPSPVAAISVTGRPARCWFALLRALGKIQELVDHALHLVHVLFQRLAVVVLKH